jgi:hypothetical protein
MTSSHHQSPIAVFFSKLNSELSCINQEDSINLADIRIF